MTSLISSLTSRQLFGTGMTAGAAPKTTLATILPITVCAERPYAPTIQPFPREKIHLLSNRASVDTNALAARLLASAGIPTPEYFLRLSIREVVCKFLDLPCVDLCKLAADSGNPEPKLAIAAAHTAAARLIAGVADAERQVC